MSEDDWLQSLFDAGFVAFNREQNRPRLSIIAATLDLVRIQHGFLKPLEKALARPNTLSSRFGLGAFPLHTDRFLDDVPPRYLILFSPRPRSTSTILWDTHQISRELKSQAVFAAGERGRKRYTRFEDSFRGNRVVRYNPAMCEPRTAAAVTVAAEIAASVSRLEIVWYEVSAVIVDNWRMLHGRCASVGDELGYLRRITGWTER